MSGDWVETFDAVFHELGEHEFTEHGELTERLVYRMWVTCRCTWEQDVEITAAARQRKAVKDAHLANVIAERIASRAPLPLLPDQPTPEVAP